MIEYIFILLLVLFIAGYYKLFYKPRKLLFWYKNTLQQLGYKVKHFPFQFLRCSLLTQLTEQQKKYSDPLYNYKNQYFNYDVLVYCSITTPILQFQNPNLIKILFQPNHIQLVQKKESIMQNIKNSYCNRMILGKNHQSKRKSGVINSIFNNQLIISNLLKISKVCESGFQLLQDQCQKNGQMRMIDGSKQFRVHLYNLFPNIFGNITFQLFFGTKSNDQKIKGQSISAFLNKLNIDIIRRNQTHSIQSLGTKFSELALTNKDKDINQKTKLWAEINLQLIKNRLIQIQKNGPQQNYQDIVQALILRGKLNSASLPTQKLKINKQAQYQYFNEFTEQFCDFFINNTIYFSNFIQIMIYLISQNKHIQERLRAQVNKIIKTDDDITKDNLNKLTYIDWIQNQIIRLYEPLPNKMLGVALKDHYIFNIPIKKGTSLAFSAVSSHYNKKYFKNPKQFKPERWESQADIRNLMVFEGGEIGCIGKNLALLQNKIALIKFMKRYKQVELPKKDFEMCLNPVYAPEKLEIILLSTKQT